MAARFIICTVLVAVVLCSDAFSDDDLNQRYITLALQGRLSPLLPELTAVDSGRTEKDAKLVEQFKERFGPDGQVELPQTDYPIVREIVVAYRTYWSDVLLHEYSKEVREGKITTAVADVLKKYGVQYPDSISPLEQVAVEFEKYGYRALTGLTLPHFDLLAWRGNEAVDYEIELTDGPSAVRVYFMSDFVSYGWSHYATFGVAYPGGWAGDDALYCMSDDYDRASEKFTVSYLKHEARHFADYARFPELVQADLEYRAKLTELVYADSSLYQLIENFSRNAARTPEAPHALANHELIRHLAQSVFGDEVVRDPERWRTVGPDVIHSAAADLLAQSTADLVKAGADTVKSLIIP
jgi:hypothetical protein